MNDELEGKWKVYFAPKNIAEVTEKEREEDIRSPSRRFEHLDGSQ
jgi:hypothetical protein